MPRRITALALALLIGASFAAAKDDLKVAEVTFLVVRDFNGKPVRNASVVLHPVSKDGKQKREGLQLKTDSQGRTSYAGVPYGKMRVQVIAPNLQTFGEDYDINQPTHQITIKLKRPQDQYSIYK